LPSVTGMYLPDACDRKRTNVQVKHTVSFKGISSSKADSNNPMHFGSAKRSMHGVYSECIWCATVAISNKPMLEMSLRMVLRDRLGQYPVDLNVNKRGSDSLRG
jgi:hypothetical protein